MKYMMLKEYSSVPFLLARLFRVNLSGRGKFLEEKYQYGEDRQQRIVFIMPKEGARKRSLLFFVHGGGWKKGNAHLFRFVGYFFARFGYATVIAGYRHVPKFRYPAQVEDTIASLSAGIEIARRFGVYHDNVILIGQSAGAQLVSLIAYSGMLNDYGLKQEIISGVVSISGAINFSECKNDYVNGFIRDFTVNDQNYRKADPYRHLSSDNLVPILCVHGEHDPSVEIENAITFVNRVNELCEGIGELLIVKNGLHSNLAKLLWGGMKEYKDILSWLEKLKEKELDR